MNQRRDPLLNQRPEDDVRAVLEMTLRAILAEAGCVGDPRVEVRLSTSSTGTDGVYSYVVHVPNEVRGLVLGSNRKHAEALATVAKMRALKLGWTGRINVHVARDG